MTTATSIYNRSDIETAQPVSVADIVKQTKERGSKFLRPFGSKRPEVERFTLHSIPANAPTRSLSLFTFPCIYRRQLRMYRRIAQVVDHHPTLSNACLWAMGIAFMIEVFLYA